jgi:hypothetical protein
MKKHLAVALILVSFVSAQAQIYFQATLDGLQEVSPNTSPGTGFANFTVHPDMSLTYTVSYQNLLAGPTASHIHGIAGVGTNAGVMIGLTGLPATTSGTFSGTYVGPVTAAQLNTMLSGYSYINIHTSLYPGGEIRGQIYLVPEPSTLALATFGAVASGILVCRRRPRLCCR